ncbi:MAG: hypothetical protein AAFQ27_09065 [Pseudomonadota bacterium]
MARFSAIKFWLHKLRKAEHSVEAAITPPQDHAQMMARAIYLREADGIVTTLRHLHKISELTQSEALKAVSKLENEGLVTIGDDTTDAFESVVATTATLRQQMAAISRRNAA